MNAKSAGGQALAVAGDVTLEADCAHVVEEALRQFGRLDALINNSGVIEPISPLRDSPAELWWHNWAVNVLGPVMLIHQALPYLRIQRGRVINISSGAAEGAIGGWAAYSSAKAALNKITQVLASEEPEIAVAALKPGVVDTEMQATIRAKGKDRMAERNYRHLSQLYETRVMNTPERPALAMACLALALPHDWSGSILQWDEERVQQLVQATEASAQGEHTQDSGWHPRQQ